MFVDTTGIVTKNKFLELLRRNGYIIITGELHYYDQNEVHIILYNNINRDASNLKAIYPRKLVSLCNFKLLRTQETPSLYVAESKNFLM